MIKRLMNLVKEKSLIIVDKLNFVARVMDLSKSKSYIFDKRVFRIGIIVLCFLLLLVAGGFSSLNYKDFNVFKDFFKPKIYVECPLNSVSPCINPLYKNMNYCGSLINENSYLCTNEFLLQGASYGDKPSFIVRHWGSIVFVLIFLMFVVNHFLFNPSFDYRSFFKKLKKIIKEDEIK